jgi:hypothetical protein
MIWDQAVVKFLFSSFRFSVMRRAAMPEAVSRRFRFQGCGNDVYGDRAAPL